jgi:hypothetical protein
MTIRFGPAPKPRPRAGDRKVDKDGVTWIRRCAVVRGINGRVEGYDCTNGRQRYVWVREGETYP